jgi:acetylornithine deacetylase/succinyl-diaminopimelate desuccinylase-like protein
LKKAGLLPKGDVIVAGVVSEEIAGFGAAMQTRDNYKLTDYAVIGEATENDLAIGCRGRFCAVVTIRGKSCHASVPHLGKNPFDFLGQFLVDLKKVELGKDELFGSSTMSVTNITSSENGSNIIPNEVVVYIDFRQSTVDTEQVALAKIQKVIDGCMVVQSCGKTKNPAIAAIIKAVNITRKYLLIFSPPEVEFITLYHLYRRNADGKCFS